MGSNTNRLKCWLRTSKNPRRVSKKVNTILHIMVLLEKIWSLVGFVLIFLILIMDPKNSASNLGSGEMSMLFNSASESQEFLKRFTWTLLATFFMLTISINYFY